MKKIITCILLLAMCVGVLGSCKPNESPDNLTNAKNFLYAMYKDEAAKTPSDYTLVASIVISGESFSVEWSATVNGEASDYVKIIPGEGEVTVDVDSKVTTDVAYVIKAVIKDTEGKTAEITFDRTIPAYKELTWAEYASSSDGDTVVVKGVVTGIMAKSKGNSSNCLYLQDSDGGYYVYSMASDPMTEAGIEIGMTVQVSGLKATYSGTLEITEGVTEIIKAEKTDVTPVDYTDKFKNAETLKDSALVSQQALLVTVKGVEITGQDTGSGYYKFKLGELETYVRISSSVCPLTKEEQTEFISGHTSHLGWTANVTGVICVFDGAFYLTPVSANAFEYISLPEKDDAGMVAFEKENLTLPTAVTEDTVIDLGATGKGYTQVAITYVSDNECAVIADGKLTVTLPEADATVKITATLTSGSVTETKEFVIAVDAASTDAYIAEPVVSPVKDTAYKFSFYQANLGKTLYFSGEMSGNYFATTDKADKAVDVYLEEVEGGFKLYFKSGDTKTYIDIYEYTEGKVGVQLTAEPKSVFTYNTELGVLTANVIGADYYLGTYKTYNTISASKTDYISGEKAADVGVSQFPAKLSTIAPAVYVAEAVASPVKDTAYKFSFYQANLGKTLYFSGEMSGNYFATTDKFDKAVDVYLEEVEGGFKLYFTSGETKTYIDIYEYTEGKVGVQLTAEPKSVFTYNTELKVLTANVIGSDYYLGTYKTYNTISASKTDYISGEKAADVGVSQFPACLSTVSAVKFTVAAAETPVKDTAYKFSFYQANLGKTLYFAGEMSGNYIATTDKLSKSVDVYLEEVEGGFKLYFMSGETKTYIDIYEYTEGKVGVQLTAEPKSVFTYNTELGVLTANVIGADYYLGTYKTYNTISASKTDYIAGEKAADVGVSQFPAKLGTIELSK